MDKISNKVCDEIDPGQYGLNPNDTLGISGGTYWMWFN